MDITLKINPVYRPYLNDQTRTQIFMGGSSSGKSVFVLGQRLPLDLLAGGRNYLVVRNVANTLRGSVYNEINKGIQELGLTHLFTVNKSEMTITCRNGYQAILKGLDDVEKIKSITAAKGVITDVVIEEATETREEDIRQLNKRLRGLSDGAKRITMIFNPVYKTHWIYKNYFAGNFADTDKEFKDDHLTILKTTYKDNRFLAQDDIYELENEKDSYFYNVYTLGNWGSLGDIIFKNWHSEDLTDIIAELYPRRNGLDFGYTNDPSALTASCKRENKIYVCEEMYEYGLTNNAIATMIKPIIGGDSVWCDSAEPKSIEELRQLGIYAQGVKKGPGSVNFGIQYLQQFEIIINKKCQNTINEFQLYQWKKNKDGQAINEPVDKFNHAIDSLRYAYDNDMNSGDFVRILTF